MIGNDADYFLGLEKISLNSTLRLLKSVFQPKGEIPAARSCLRMASSSLLKVGLGVAVGLGVTGVSGDSGDSGVDVNVAGLSSVAISPVAISVEVGA